MNTNNINPENNIQLQKENWSKPEVSLLSVNSHTLGTSTNPGGDTTGVSPNILNHS